VLSSSPPVRINLCSPVPEAPSKRDRLSSLDIAAPPEKLARTSTSDQEEVSEHVCRLGLEKALNYYEDRMKAVEASLPRPEEELKRLHSQCKNDEAEFFRECTRLRTLSSHRELFWSQFNLATEKRFADLVAQNCKILLAKSQQEQERHTRNLQMERSKAAQESASQQTCRTVFDNARQRLESRAEELQSTFPTQEDELKRKLQDCKVSTLTYFR